jgi:hypothetical protein
MESEKTVKLRQHFAYSEIVSFVNVVLSKFVQGVTFLACILEVPSSNLDLTPTAVFSS